MRHAITANPFYQPARQWQIRIPVAYDYFPAVEEAFEDIALAASSFEVDEAAGRWVVELVTDTPPDPDRISERLRLLAAMLGIDALSYEVHPLEPRDWVRQVEQSFPALTVERFHIYGSHITAPPPRASIGLKITAGAAFGSGEHATTSGCLRALGLLARRRRFMHSLDMGCGSGILAIAMAKLWHRPVAAVDIDPVSIAVARENARLNRTQRLLRCEAGDGYATPLVRAQGPFDLITANILARPLMRMAPKLAHHLRPGGIAVLSGLLASQERMVLAAHRAQGMRLFHRITQNGWQTLILEK